MRTGRFLLLRRLGTDTRAVAMVEFAMVLPLLLGLYLGGYVLSDALACNRKVTVATRTLTDLATRCPALRSTGDATDPCDNSNILAASAYVMAPYSTTAALVRLTEVQVTGTTTTDPVQATVIWSKAKVTTDARKAGDTINLPSGMVTSSMLPNATASPPVTGAYLLLGEVSETYKPAIGYGSMTSFLLSDRIFMLPRLNQDLPQQ